MISSSSSTKTASFDSRRHSQQGSDLGKDPLVEFSSHGDSFLSDNSFCNVDLKDCSSPKPGTSSPNPEVSGYFIPNDYPKNLGLDKEFKVGGSREPYVVAEREDIPLFGTLSAQDPKRGSLDMSNIAAPGLKHEMTLNSIPKLYPSLESEEESFKSCEDLSRSSCSPSQAPHKARTNPFSESGAALKGTRNTVLYTDVIHPPSLPFSETSTPCETRDMVGYPGALREVKSSPGSMYRAHGLHDATSSSSSSNSFSTSSSKSQMLDSFVSANMSVSPAKWNHIPEYTPKLKAPVRSQGQSSEIDEVVTAIKGTFNNAFQYIASLPGNSFDSTSSICFLGKLYMGKHFLDERRLESESVEDRHGTFHDFLCDFQSRVWVTYRRGFAALPGTSLTTDTGWGCMVRTGQMLLATALQIHCFGRNWRRNSHHDQYRFQEMVRLFGDSFDQPFCLQHLLKIGKEHLNKSFGEWYGPSTVAYVLRVCVDNVKQKGLASNVVKIQNFVVFTATDCMVFKGDITNTATVTNTAPWIKTLLLISVRMGADELNLAYRPSIQTFLSSHLCIGIMGGRKRHSLYFTGFQGNKLIHYDPHTCQNSLKMRQQFNTESYVCVKPRKMSFSKMDPSCTFAFYLSTPNDLEELCSMTESMREYKIFEVLDGTKEDYLTLVHDPSIKAFDHNESMFDEGIPGDIASLEGSDFEYLE